MKKTVLILFLLFFLENAFSQTEQTGVRFGFKAGYSLAAQYGVTPKDMPYNVDSEYRHGFAGGVFAYFPITKAFGVQQEFLYVMKGSTQNITMKEQPVSASSKYKLSYFELPLMFRYTFVRLGDVGLYASSGFALSVLIDGAYDVAGVANMGEGEASFGESGDMKGVDKFDYSFLYGAGANFKLLRKDCFFEYRFTIGWNELMMPTFGEGNPAPLRNQDYIFTLGMYL